MTRKTFALFLAGVLCVIVACALSIPPVKAQGPIGGALATLAAATAQAIEVQQAQRAAEAARRATAEAVSIESTRIASQVQNTATAISAQATQSALDELQRQRSMTATAQAQSIAATRTAQEATATAEALNVQATRETYQAQATAQVILWAEQATAVARQNETAATRQQRFSWGLLVIELGMIAGALWVLWKLSGTLAAWAVKMRPQTEPVLSDVLAAATAQPSAGSVVIDQEQEPESRMPSFVQVVDNPQMEAAISQWAERYDAEHGGDNGNQ